MLTIGCRLRLPALWIGLSRQFATLLACWQRSTTKTFRSTFYWSHRALTHQQPYLGDFIQAVWGLLCETDMSPKNDQVQPSPYASRNTKPLLQLVCNAMTFLARSAEREHYKEYFAAEGVLGSICEKVRLHACVTSFSPRAQVIVPNMIFQDNDLENFQFNPEEYIRRDIEGSGGLNCSTCQC